MIQSNIKGEQMEHKLTKEEKIKAGMKAFLAYHPDWDAIELYETYAWNEEFQFMYNDDDLKDMYGIDSDRLLALACQVVKEADL